MPRVVHFEIMADDLDRAAKFYREVFGWEMKKWEGGQQEYWMVMTGPEDKPGINGGLMKRTGPAAAGMGAFICTMDVPSVDDFVGKVIKAGGSVARPKMALAGMGWLAYCLDSEGNTFGMMQEDKSAQ